MKLTILEKLARGIKHTNVRECAMKMHPMLPSFSGHLLKLTKGLIFITITFSEIRMVLRVPSGPLSAVSDFQLLVQMGQNVEELHKFLDTFFTTLTTRCSYN